MNDPIARSLYGSARAHALSGNLLYNAAVEQAAQADHPDPEVSAFNGVHSLSIHYLIGLSLELYLKAAYVLKGGAADDKSLRELGHNLVKSLDATESLGFVSAAPHLRQIAGLINEPYSRHYFRYIPPEQMALPSVQDIYRAFQTLDDELHAILFAAE